MTVTQWFIVKEKPKHKGWYECRYVRPYWPGDKGEILYTLPCFRYWNGWKWSMDETETNATSFGSKAIDQWRGLAEKPLI